MDEGRDKMEWGGRGVVQSYYYRWQWSGITLKNPIPDFCAGAYTYLRKSQLPAWRQRKDCPQRWSCRILENRARLVAPSTPSQGSSRHDGEGRAKTTWPRVPGGDRSRGSGSWGARGEMVFLSECRFPNTLLPVPDRPLLSLASVLFPHTLRPTCGRHPRSGRWAVGGFGR